MKRVAKIFLLLGMLYSSLFASIDEYKSDLYYANGIMINVSEKKATKIWQVKVKELLSKKQESYEKLEKIQNSYNRSQGFFDDLFESLEQKISNEFGWKQLSGYVTAFLTTHNIQEDWRFHIGDLNKQVASYKQSIKDGHGVIVIAHSQGNYYTNEAYEKLDDWMKEYFHMFGVATPANHVAGFAAGDTTAPYVKFHNDFIKTVIGGLPTNMHNPNPDQNSVLSVAAHNFYDSYLTAISTKEKILSFIEDKIQEQVKAQSQWATNEEIGEGTKDFRITVKHIYDADIVMYEKVFPFAANKKLYQVPDTAGMLHYVKASFGGEKILSADDVNDWEAKKGQFYKLEGTDPVEYIEGEISCTDPSLFEVVSQENENTADWRVSVKNKETNEITEGVYPFNLQGSLYQLDSGEWVLASCGGMEIVTTWDGKTESEFYKLKGTEEVIKGKMGECNNAPYKPDHFEISWDFAIEEGNRKFVYYHNNPQEQGARLGFSISAVDADGYMFTNIDNNCYPEDVNVTISFDTFGEKSLDAIIQPKDENKSLQPFAAFQDSGNQYSFLIKTSDFTQGHVRKDFKVNFERSTNVAKNPLKLTIRDVNISFAGAIGSNSKDKDVTFVYAAAYVPLVNIPRGYDQVNTKVYYEVYCRDFSRQDFNITGYESVDHYAWYKLESDDNLDFDNPISLYSYVIISKYSKDYIQSMPNGSIPLGTKVIYTPKDYLLYDKDHPDVKIHSFKLRYL